MEVIGGSLVKSIGKELEARQDWPIVLHTMVHCHLSTTVQEPVNGNSKDGVSCPELANYSSSLSNMCPPTYY